MNTGSENLFSLFLFLVL